MSEGVCSSKGVDDQAPGTSDGAAASPAQDAPRSDVSQLKLSEEDRARVSRVFIEFVPWMRSEGMTRVSAHWFGLLLGRASGIVRNDALPPRPNDYLVEKGLLQLSLLLHTHMPGSPHAFRVVDELYSLAGVAR